MSTTSVCKSCNNINVLSGVSTAKTTDAIFLHTYCVFTFETLWILYFNFSYILFGNGGWSVSRIGSIIDIQKNNLSKARNGNEKTLFKQVCNLGNYIIVIHLPRAMLSDTSVFLSLARGVTRVKQVFRCSLSPHTRYSVNRQRRFVNIVTNIQRMVDAD